MPFLPVDFAGIAYATKAPTEDLDYGSDWTDWLGSDTITSSDWVADPGVTLHTKGNSTKTTSVWVSGGVIGTTYILTNNIGTALGRTPSRVIKLEVRLK